MSLSIDDLNEMTAKAQAAPRRRSHHNLHPTLDAPVQRLAIAMEPDTYVRPHRHPQTWELYFPLRGSLKVVIFDDEARVQACHILGGDEGLRVFELPANTWHSVLSLETGSVIFEVKEGPYIRPSEADTGAWAPEEDSDGVAGFLRFLGDARPGDRYGA